MIPQLPTKLIMGLACWKFSWQHGVKNSPWSSWVIFLTFLEVISTCANRLINKQEKKSNPQVLQWHLIAVIQHKETLDYYKSSV